MEDKYPNIGDVDLEKEAPLLASLKGKPFPMEVPDGYFESLTDQVMNKVRTEDGHSSGNPGAAAQVRKMLPVSIAAVLAMLVLFASFVYFGSQGEQVTDLSQLSSEEILLALEMEDLDEDFLLDAMGDEALASLDLEQQLQHESVSEYFEEENLLQDLEFNLQEEDLDWLDENYTENEL